MKNQKTFADVAGLVEEKEQLEEIVDFLGTAEIYEFRCQNPERRDYGGPPGNR